VRSAHFTVGPHGKRVTAGIPGTGLFYTSTALTIPDLPTVPVDHPFFSKGDHVIKIKGGKRGLFRAF